MMKKLLFGIAALMLMASCNGNKAGSENTDKDSSSFSDSIAQLEVTNQAEETALAAAEQARIDSLRQDSIAKVEKTVKKASQYDELINQYVSAVNTVEKAAHKGQWNKMQSLCDKAQRLRNKIDKVKKDLTPEQSAKFKKAVSKWGRLLDGVIAG